MKKEWIDKFKGLAEHIATWSKDRTPTRVGAVIVDDRNIELAHGYNGFPRGVNDEVDTRHERPLKYQYTVHAEANAIASAAFKGSCVRGGTIFVTLFPCPQCTGLIINAGIKKVVCPPPDFEHVTYGPLFSVSLEMLQEAGAEVEHV